MQMSCHVLPPPLSPASLAVVIPAYKGKYFRETLDSLSRQSDKRFRVYIGDDCSPDNLGRIVEDYKGVLDIMYRRFTENLGGTDLVAHWSRCLDMVGDEEYVCMFSDDDILMPEAVGAFFKSVESAPDFDVWHFNIAVMDASGKISYTPAAYSRILSSREFFRQLYDRHTIDARMPEFIFRTSSLRSTGFVKFDMAYRTDNATVMLLAEEKGICSVPGVNVLWRDSGENVSSSRNMDSVCRRLDASICFFNWTETFFRGNTPVRFKRRIKMYLNEILLLHPHFSYDRMLGCMMELDYFKKNMLHRLAGRYWLKKMYKRKLSI